MYIQFAGTELNYRVECWLARMRGSLVHCACISHCYVSVRSLAVYKTGITTYLSELREATQPCLVEYKHVWISTVSL